MQLIDGSGTRQACDRCHRVRVRIARGTVCEQCQPARRPKYQILESTRAQREFLREALAIREYFRTLRKA